MKLQTSFISGWKCIGMRADEQPMSIAIGCLLVALSHIVPSLPLAVLVFLLVLLQVLSLFLPLPTKEDILQKEQSGSMSLLLMLWPIILLSNMILILILLIRLLI